MPLTPEDFVLPPGGTGELDPAWWSTGLLVDSLLPVWIGAGEGQVPEGAESEAADAVVQAYTYGTAYDNKALAMATGVNSLSVDGGDLSLSFSKDQRDRVAERAKFWWERFATAVAEAVPVVAAVIDNAPRASFAQPVVRGF